jgi:DNA-binding response OmpR family regulator
VPKILIIDDDPDIVDAGRLVLEREGYEVVGAPNRADGMKKLEEIKPDLLILDVMMEEPDDGLRMAREIRKNGNEVPIISDRVNAMASGRQDGRRPGRRVQPCLWNRRRWWPSQSSQQ